MLKTGAVVRRLRADKLAVLRNMLLKHLEYREHQKTIHESNWYGERYTGSGQLSMDDGDRHDMDGNQNRYRNQECRFSIQILELKQHDVEHTYNDC